MNLIVSGLCFQIIKDLPMASDVPPSPPIDETAVAALPAPVDPSGLPLSYVSMVLVIVCMSLLLVNIGL